MTAQLDSLSSLKFPPLHCRVFVGLGLKRGGFVDDTKSVNSRDSRSVFCGLSLRVIEVCRDSDDSITDGTSKVGFGSRLHLKE